MQDYQKETRAALQSGLEQTKQPCKSAVETAAKKKTANTYLHHLGIGGGSHHHHIRT